MTRSGARNGHCTVAAAAPHTDGRVVAGLLTEETTDTLVMTEPVSGHQQRIPLANVATRQQTGVSVMPAAQVNQLSNRQQFLDLISYLFAVRDGGPQRAKELQPPPSLFALKIPEYEARVDHSGLIRDLDKEAYERGQKIYKRLCFPTNNADKSDGHAYPGARFKRE